MRIFEKFFISAIVLLIVTLLCVEARAEKKIGLLLCTEEARYHEARNGVMDQLKENGFGEPAVKYITENAEGSKNKANKIMEKFIAEKVALIVTFGTNAAVAATKATKDVPIVFSHVYDPVEAGVALGWKSSGNNTTGAATRVPMEKLLKSLKEFAPVKRLGVLYAPGEKQTEIQLKELQKVQAEFQIQVLPIILTEQDQVSRILPDIVRTVDAISFPGGSISGKNVETIVEMASKAKVVTISHLDDLVKKGVLLGVCVNSYGIGRLAGKKAAAILKGAKPSSIPIEPPLKLDIILNKKTATAGDFTISPEFMKTVTRTIE